MNKIDDRKQNHFDSESGMSIIVKTLTRLTVGIFLLYGISLMLNGHIYLGGGFAGGGVMALAFLNLILAFGKDIALERLNQTLASIIVSLGLLAFVAIGSDSLCGGYFFTGYSVQRQKSYFPLFSGIAPLYNICIGLLVGAGFFAIFVCLIMMKVKKEK